jgi:cytochrome c-type biogenesis protein CcmH/NrfG
MRRRPLLGAVALTVLLAVYLVAVSGRGIALVRTGDPVGIALGAAVLVLPLLGVWLIAREWQLAVRVQQMADELSATGGLPVDDLPRTPGGRIDRAAADAAFASAQVEVEAAPGEWAPWFRLGFAYDAAGDRRRARGALRTAARLHGG